MLRIAKDLQLASFAAQLCRRFEPVDLVFLCPGNSAEQTLPGHGARTLACAAERIAHRRPAMECAGIWSEPLKWDTREVDILQRWRDASGTTVNLRGNIKATAPARGIKFGGIYTSLPEALDKGELLAVGCQ